MNRPPPKKPAKRELTVPKREPQTAKELAEVLGVTRQAIGYHVRKSPDCPTTFDTEEWRAFLAAKGREGSTGTDIHKQIAEVKLENLKIKRDREKDELLESRHLLIPWKDVQAILSELVLLHYWGEFDRMTQEFPPRLAGLNPAQIHTEFRREKEKMVKNLHEVVNDFFKRKGPKK